jgi:hypothetical protein
VDFAFPQMTNFRMPPSLAGFLEIDATIPLDKIILYLKNPADVYFVSVFLSYRQFIVLDLRLQNVSKFCIKNAPNLYRDSV